MLITLSVLLCGCSDSASDDSKGNTFNQGIKSQQDSNKNTSAVILQITINPVFTIHLDDEDNVSQIICVNDDADKLFADMDVVGMTYQKAMPVILNKAYEMEFITTDSTEITMEIIVQGEMNEAQMEKLSISLKKPITEFQEEKELVLEVTDADILEGIKVVTSPYGNGYYHGYYDSNDTLIKEIYDYDDVYICKEYDTNGVCIMHMENNATNYFEQYYDKDGNTTKEILIDYRDGSRNESTYYKNGSTKSLIQDFTDGGHHEHYYYENGNLQKFINDRGYEEQYYENGNMKSLIQDLPEGHVEQFFYENGNMQKHIVDGVDGTHYEVLYDENGNLIEE